MQVAYKLNRWSFGGLMFTLGKCGSPHKISICVAWCVYSLIMSWWSSIYLCGHLFVFYLCPCMCFDLCVNVRISTNMFYYIEVVLSKSKEILEHSETATADTNEIWFLTSADAFAFKGVGSQSKHFFQNYALECIPHVMKPKGSHFTHCI